MKCMDSCLVFCPVGIKDASSAYVRLSSVVAKSLKGFLHVDRQSLHDKPFEEPQRNSRV